MNAAILAALIISTAAGNLISVEDLDVHPRPDWARPCMLLNGPWGFDFDPEDAGIRDKWFEDHAFSKSIEVPYPWQSALSGIGDTEYQGAAWYQREVAVPKAARGRYFLVFGAVDWHATVWVNGKKAAEHEGGYLPFDVELTDLVKPGETARITVRAYDVTDPEAPTGKQTGWYTPSGGIWQTVYLEFRGTSYLKKAHVTPDIDLGQAIFDCEVVAASPGTYAIVAEAVHDDRRFAAEGKVRCEKGLNRCQLTISIPSPELWTPETPNLYDTRIALKRGRRVEDRVRTYFGMRKVSRGTYGGSDFEYILLNDKPVYLRGALHQSFTPEGLYTHPDDDYIRRDYEKAKEFGLNFIRIHIKTEEPRCLYWADTLGVLLMCDVPCFAKKTDRAKQLWEETMRGMIERDFNHPSIFSWCDFNETWGIRDGGYDWTTQEWVQAMFHLTKSLDPTRLIEDNSPCRYDHVETDINSWHFYIDRYDAAKAHIENVVAETYPGSAFNYAEGWKQGTAPLINSEYGGVSAASGDRDISWVFLHLTNLLRRHDKIGGYVYTELEDIEWEHNGYMNYDRSPKEYHYPAGITLADLQGADVPVLDCPPYQQIDAGATVEVPVLLSHWTEKEGLTLRLSVDGTTIDGKAWSDWVEPKEWVVENAAPFRVTPQGAYTIAAPAASGLMNVIAEVLCDGRRCGATYCVIDVRNGPAWEGAGQYAVTFPVDKYSALTFESPINVPPENTSKVFGFKTGAIEYELKFPWGFRGEKVESVRLLVEMASKAEDELLDWPERRKPQDYPQTDGRTWPSDVTVSVCGVPVKQVSLENDYADARGVLSHVAHYHHGSCGLLHDLAIEGEALDALKETLSKRQPVTLRFEVPEDAEHAGGLALYGADMGAWPCDPALVFTLKDGVKKPKKGVRAKNAMVGSVGTYLATGPNAQTWRYTTEKPGDGWASVDFDDAAWLEGKGGFGKKRTPGARLGTEWTERDIWMRTEIPLPRKAKKGPLWVDVHHDDAVEVFVNGEPLVSREGYRRDYERIPLSPEQVELFKGGKGNIIAVHCHQDGGGQYVDVGIGGYQAGD